jgi:hypothetical protein
MRLNCVVYVHEVYITVWWYMAMLYLIKPVLQWYDVLNPFETPFRTIHCYHPLLPAPGYSANPLKSGLLKVNTPFSSAICGGTVGFADL